MEKIIHEYIDMHYQVRRNLENSVKDKEEFDTERSRKYGLMGYEIMQNFDCVLETIDEPILVEFFKCIGLRELLKKCKKQNHRFLTILKKAYPKQDKYELISTGLFVETLHLYNNDLREWKIKYKEINKVVNRLCSYYQMPNNQKLEKLLSITTDFVDEMLFYLIMNKSQHSPFPHMIPTIIWLVCQIFNEERKVFIENYIDNSYNVVQLQGFLRHVFPTVHNNYKYLLEIIKERVLIISQASFAVKLLKEADVKVDELTSPEFYITVSDTEEKRTIRFNSSFDPSPNSKATYPNTYIINIYTPEGRSNFVGKRAKKDNVHSVKLREQIEPQEVKAYITEIANDNNIVLDWKKVYIDGNRTNTKKLMNYWDSH